MRYVLSFRAQSPDIAATHAQISTVMAHQPSYHISNSHCLDNTPFCGVHPALDLPTTPADPDAKDPAAGVVLALYLNHFRPSDFALIAAFVA